MCRSGFPRRLKRPKLAERRLQPPAPPPLSKNNSLHILCFSIRLVLGKEQTDVLGPARASFTWESRGCPARPALISGILVARGNKASVFSRCSSTLPPCWLGSRKLNVLPLILLECFFLFPFHYHRKLTSTHHSPLPSGTAAERSFSLSFRIHSFTCVMLLLHVNILLLGTLVWQRARAALLVSQWNTEPLIVLAHVQLLLSCCEPRLGFIGQKGAQWLRPQFCYLSFERTLKCVQLKCCTLIN